MYGLRLAGFLNGKQLSCLHFDLLATLQVLDDSTDKATRDLVDDKCLEWRERGVTVTCLRRTNRQGYKAGALKEVGNLQCHTAPTCTASVSCCGLILVTIMQGLEQLAEYDYVGIFDADFKPEPDFLVCLLIPNDCTHLKNISTVAIMADMLCDIAAEMQFCCRPKLCPT